MRAPFFFLLATSTSFAGWPAVLMPDDGVEGTGRRTSKTYQYNGFVYTIWDSPSGGGSGNSTEEPVELVRLDVVTGDGIAVAEGAGEYEKGGTAIITYALSPGYENAAADGEVTASPGAFEVSMTTNRTITISASAIPRYTLRVLSGEGVETATGSGQYERGEVASVSATVGFFYDGVSFSGDVDGAVIAGSQLTAPMTANRTIIVTGRNVARTMRVTGVANGDLATVRTETPAYFANGSVGWYDLVNFDAIPNSYILFHHNGSYTRSNYYLTLSKYYSSPNSYSYNGQSYSQSIAFTQFTSPTATKSVNGNNWVRRSYETWTIPNLRVDLFETEALGMRYKYQYGFYGWDYVYVTFSQLWSLDYSTYIHKGREYRKSVTVEGAGSMPANPPAVLASTSVDSNWQSETKWTITVNGAGEVVGGTNIGNGEWTHPSYPALKFIVSWN